MERRIKNLYVALKKLGLHRELTKLAGEPFESTVLEPGILFYKGTRKSDLRRIEFHVDLGGANRESVKSFIDKVKEMNGNPGVIEEGIYYKAQYSEAKPATLYGDKIRLPWTFFNDERVESTIQFFEKNFPGLFDMELARKTKGILKEIEWPKLRDPSSRSSEHMDDIIMEKIDDLVSRGKGKDFIQDFINGFYAYLEESLREYTVHKTKKNFSSKPEAWKQGYIFRMEASQIGDVISRDSQYNAETWDKPVFLTRQQEIMGRGISPDILAGEDLLKVPERRDPMITVGDYYFENGNLSGISFDVMDRAKAKAENFETKTMEIPTPDDASYGWKSLIGRIQLIKKWVDELAGDVKNSLSLLEAKREALGDRKPTENESLFAGRMITRIVNSAAYITEYQAESKSYIRAFNDEVKKYEGLIEELRKAIELNPDIPASAIETFENAMNGYIKGLEIIGPQVKILEGVVDSSNSLLEDASLGGVVKMIS